MTITFPRAMLCGVVQADFSINRPMAVNRLNGGVTQVRELGASRWVGRFTYAGFMRARFQELQAWLDSLRGGLNLFYGHDPLRPFPITYPSGAYPGGFTGVGTVTAIGPDWINVATVGGFVLKAGDHVGLVEGTKRGLFRIVEDIAGSPATLWVEPGIPPGQFTTAATCNFSRPVCTMVLEPGSVSATRTAGAPSSISFAGVQRVI